MGDLLFNNSKKARISIGGKLKVLSASPVRPTGASAGLVTTSPVLVPLGLGGSQTLERMDSEVHSDQFKIVSVAVNVSEIVSSKSLLSSVPTLRIEMGHWKAQVKVKNICVFRIVLSIASHVSFFRQIQFRVILPIGIIQLAIVF